jgi:hypothetical protein
MLFPFVGLEAMLLARGYAVEAPTNVMVADLGPREVDPRVRLARLCTVSALRDGHPIRLRANCALPFWDGLTASGYSFRKPLGVPEGSSFDCGWWRWPLSRSGFDRSRRRFEE